MEHNNDKNIILPGKAKVGDRDREVVNQSGIDKNRDENSDSEDDNSSIPLVLDTRASLTRKSTGLGLIFWLLAIFIAVNLAIITFAFVTITQDNGWAVAEKLLTILFTAILTLVSCAVGFHFGQHHSK